MFSKYLTWRRRKATARSRAGRSEHRFRPGMERLEDRTVPATLTTPAQDFVALTYLNLLGRAVDDNGLAFWSNRLNQGESLTNLVRDIEHSQEFLTNAVQGLYQRFLHRAADPGGLSFFVNFLGSGNEEGEHHHGDRDDNDNGEANLDRFEQVIVALVSSPEYFQSRGGGTNQGFLTAVYQDALGRAIDTSGRTFFTQALAAGASRDQVATIIVSSVEFRTLEVQLLYQQILHRPADQAGLAHWVNQLQSGETHEELVADLQGSSEALVLAETLAASNSLTPENEFFGTIKLSGSLTGTVDDRGTCTQSQHAIVNSSPINLTARKIGGGFFDPVYQISGTLQFNQRTSDNLCDNYSGTYNYTQPTPVTGMLNVEGNSFTFTMTGASSNTTQAAGNVITFRGTFGGGQVTGTWSFDTAPGSTTQGDVGRGSFSLTVGL